MIILLSPTAYAPMLDPVLLVDGLLLGLVQGITEFLPISSHAHLQLVSAFTGWPDQGLIIDVAVHVGTLGAVMVYFWRDLWDMTAGVLRLLMGRGSRGARLAGGLDDLAVFTDRI